MQRVTSVDGHDLFVHVEDVGSGGQASSSAALGGVLLLHGLAQEAPFWGPVTRRMRTRPVAMLDQRGHGESDVPVGSDFSVDAAATDVLTVLDALGWEQAVLVGHSWGAAVALAAAARDVSRVRALGLIDGGLWSMSELGPRDDVRVALTPPPNASRLGFERHMLVLDGLLDYDAYVDLESLARTELLSWGVVCDERAGSPWQGLRDRAASEAKDRGFPLIHRWAGAVHDVPLQWPAMVAGWIDALAEEAS